MENAISTLKYFNTSKVGINSFVDKVVSEVEGGLINPLDLVIYLRSIEKSVDGINGRVKQMILDEADKYSEKTFEYKGALISKEELGVKYDYENCEDLIWNKLDSEIKDLMERKKDREAFLKTIKDSIGYTDTETGETWKVNPPIKRSTSGIKVTIK